MNFNHIPADLRVPLFFAEMDNSMANSTENSGPSLIIARALPAAPMERNSLLIMSSAARAGQVAGRGSQLARMVAAYRAADPSGELWVVAVNDSEGEAATGTLTLTGHAQASGMLSVYISATRIPVRVTASETSAAVGGALAAAINARPDLPVTATSLAGVVTLTAKNTGLTGNHIPVSVNYRGVTGGEQTPAGLSLVITPMEGGTGVPDMAATVTALGDEPFDFIACPFNDSASLATLGNAMNEETGRWSWARQLYGHVYTAKTGELSDLVAFGTSFNDPHLSIAGYETGVQRATDELVAVRTARNAVFIRNDPARPVQTGLLTEVLPAPPGKRFLLTEQQALLSHGIATALTEGGALRIQREITTCQKNVWGEADNSFLDSETLHISAYVLRRLKAVITGKYPRHKLAADGTRSGPGQAIVTPCVIRSELLSVYRQLEREGIVENAELFSRHLIVERNARHPDRLDVLFPPDYVSPLRVFALLNQFRLQYREEEA